MPFKMLEPVALTGDAALDDDIRRAFNVLNHLADRARLDAEDAERLTIMVAGCIHNLTLEVRRLREVVNDAD